MDARSDSRDGAGFGELWSDVQCEFMCAGLRVCSLLRLIPRDMECDSCLVFSKSYSDS